MKILAVDTATPDGSVAIIDGENVLCELISRNSRTHAVHLMNMIERALDQAGMTLSGLDGVAVAVGPGSFTGIRIGLATVKGLAMGRNLSLSGVSSLKALANSVPEKKRLICSMIDARRNEVYYSFFQKKNARLIRITEDTVGHVNDALEGLSGPMAFVGNGSLAYRRHIRQRLGNPAKYTFDKKAIPTATNVALLAAGEFIKDKTISPEKLLPIYIRRPDARLPEKETILKR